MPELPEVETIRQDLIKVLVGRKIVGVEIIDKKAIKSSLASFKEVLLNKKITNIDRIGKLMIIDLGGKDFLLVHLKMTGQLIYRYKDKIIEGGHSLSVAPTKEFPPKYAWVIWSFDDGAKLCFSDMRKFGYLKIVGGLALEKIVGGYGPEPLTKNFTYANFIAALGKRTAPIKSLLLNQALIAGIGNIYADEACFEAKIFPGTPANKLTEAEKKNLFTAINYILKKAIKHKGTTFKDYLSPHGKKGNFSDLLKVYKRDKQNCFRCLTAIIANKKISGRSSRYCPVCQKMLK
jgi:formamidopyrimidine-DNA glycosylase